MNTELNQSSFFLGCFASTNASRQNSFSEKLPRAGFLTLPYFYCKIFYIHICSLSISIRGNSHLSLPTAERTIGRAPNTNTRPRNSSRDKFLQTTKRSRIRSTLKHAVITPKKEQIRESSRAYDWLLYLQT